MKITNTTLGSQRIMCANRAAGPGKARDPEELTPEQEDELFGAVGRFLDYGDNEETLKELMQRLLNLYPKTAEKLLGKIKKSTSRE